MVNLEKERRFLVEIPLKWYGKFKTLTSEKVRIFQSYLKEEGEECSRVRVVCDYRPGYPPVSYIYTKKKYVSYGVNIETETDLTQGEHSVKLNTLSDRTKNRITKTRYFIRFDNRIFHFDVFEEKLLGLAILEIELKDMAERVITPPYLKIIKEVTGDREYSNINLATIETYKYSVLRDKYLSEEKTNKFARRID